MRSDKFVLHDKSHYRKNNSIGSEYEWEEEKAREPEKKIKNNLQKETAKGKQVTAPVETKESKMRSAHIGSSSSSESENANDEARGIRWGDVKSPSSTDDTMNAELDPNFNPMKPRRQLSRSPIAVSIESSVQRRLDRAEIPLPVPLRDESVEQLPEPDELKKDVIEDWDEHKANLVKCRICGRSLYPHRIPKHEASCQNI